MAEAKSEGPFSPEETKLLKSTWAEVEKIQEAAAEIFYKRVFDTSGDSAKLFDGIDMKEQGKKLFSMISAAMGLLDDPENLVPALQKLGERHVKYGVKEAHFEPVGAALLWTLEKGLGDAWTDEVKAAYINFYSTAQSVMVPAMKKVGMCGCGAGCACEVPCKCGQEADKPPFSEAEIKMLRSTWSEVEKISDAAAEMFYKRVFDTAGDEAANLFDGIDMKEQGKKLFSMISAAMGLLDDVDNLVPALQKLGERHVKYGVKQAHFEPVGAALLWTLEKGLGDAWTDDVKSAYINFYTTAQSVMVPAMKKVGMCGCGSGCNCDAPCKCGQSSDPPFTEDEIKTLRSTWSEVEKISEAAAEMFYKRVFDTAGEEATKLFDGIDMKEQGKKLFSMISAAMGLLDDVDNLVPALQQLGERHVKYGVKEAHFEPVGAALLWTLGKGLGDAWTDDVKETYVKFYTTAQSVMVPAMKEVGMCGCGSGCNCDAPCKCGQASDKPPFTDAEKEILKSTWSEVEQIQDAAAEMFYKRVFDTGGEEVTKLFDGTDMKEQGKKLFGMISAAMGLIDDLDNLVPTLQNLGKRHVQYGAKESHFAPVGAALLHTLEKGLGDKWTDEVKAAYTNFYQTATNVMVPAMKEAGMCQCGSGCDCSVPCKCGESEEKSDAPFTEKQKQILFSTWAEVEKIEVKAADMFYRRVFETSEESANLFDGVEMKEQGRKLFSMISTAVGMLDELDKLVPALQELGKRHTKYGVREFHFEPVGSALLWTLEQGLGDQWTDEVKETWTHFYSVAQGTMVPVMKDAGVCNCGPGCSCESPCVCGRADDEVVLGDEVEFKDMYGDRCVGRIVDIQKDMLKISVTQHSGTMGSTVTHERWAKIDICTRTDVAERKEEFDFGSIEFDENPEFTAAVQKIIKESWAKVYKNKDEFVESFYKHLCENDERSQELFQKVDMKKQGVRFLEVMNHAVEEIGNFKKYVPNLKLLGNKHTDYLVDDDHYTPFGKSLCWALETQLKKDWTRDTRKCWIQFYGVIQATMRKGAQEAETKVTGCSCIIS